jgi:L-lactate dehydrogenase complex protein LldG
VTNNDARAEILSWLRGACQAQRPLFRRGSTAATRIVPPSTVTHAEGGGPALARVFGDKLAALSGSYEIVERRADVAERVKQRVLDWRASDDRLHRNEVGVTKVLSWAPGELPIPDLAAGLRSAGIELVVPGDLSDRDARSRAADMEIGLTGVAAAFAATGSLAFAPAGGRSRAASLLPGQHIALVPFSRIYATLESWLSELRSTGQLIAFTRQSRQLVFVTGPSKSADIELNLTLGVHGPRIVHAVLFDDSR